MATDKTRIDEWRHTRHTLRTDAATFHALRRLYGLTDPRTYLLSRPEWELPRAIPVDDLVVNVRPLEETPAARYVAADGVLPPDALPQERYSDVVQRLAPPTLFRDQLCYRMVALSREGATCRLDVGAMRYFEFFDQGEAMRHELAVIGDDMTRALLRRSLGDLTNLENRKVIIGVSVVTLRVESDGRATFLLHRRDRSAVATEQDQWHVVPCGVFQPTSEDTNAWYRDADLGALIEREIAEELLGMDEHNGNADLLRKVHAARDQGGLRLVVTGIGVNPVLGSCEILCAAVFTAHAFDETFADVVATTDEGTLLAARPGVRGFEFSDDVIEDVTTAHPFAPSGAAALWSAWRHRDELTAANPTDDS